jgi:hypothetical protein
MKSSWIRSLVIFVAGAGSATVVAGLYPSDEITAEQWQERAIAVLAEVETLGGYVGIADDGRVGIYTQVGACVPPIPIPKWPAHAVEPRSLRKGAAGLVALNEGLLFEEPRPVYVLGKCKPYATSLLR